MKATRQLLFSELIRQLTAENGLILVKSFSKEGSEFTVKMNIEGQQAPLFKALLEQEDGALYFFCEASGGRWN